MLERETAREKNVEKAHKEAKVRARKTSIAAVAADDPRELPTAAAEAETEVDSGDDIAQVPDTFLDLQRVPRRASSRTIAIECHVPKYYWARVWL